MVIHRYCERDSIACGLRVSLEGAGIKYSLSGRIVKCLVTGWAHEDQRYDAPATIDDECEFGGGFAAQGRVDEVARHISFIDATDFGAYQGNVLRADALCAEGGGFAAGAALCAGSFRRIVGRGPWRRRRGRRRGRR